MNAQTANGQTANGQTVIDVSSLPDHAYGQRSILWWATLGFCLIEGTAFVLALVSYFYLRGKTDAWPPDGLQPPDLVWGTVNTLLLLASCFPNQWAKERLECLEATWRPCPRCHGEPGAGCTLCFPMPANV